MKAKNMKRTKETSWTGVENSGIIDADKKPERGRKMMIPPKKVLDFLDWEVGAFFHFGIRSFFPGHEDWDGKPMPMEKFNPQELNCDQWMEAARAMGAKYAIMTCKHHDGFALWPSEYTHYSVKNTPFGRDVVQHFVDACRRADMKVGLYYSPAQWGDEQAKMTDEEYESYFINQLSELLYGYGKIDYLWLDGCGSEGKNYDHERITREIRRLQPGILIFGDVLKDGADIRWIGNEEGVTGLDNSCVADRIAFSVNDEGRQTEKRFMPAECDMRLRFSSWFDCKDNEDDLTDADELMGNYEMSVGRSCNLLINAGPNSRGLLHESDVNVMRAFGEKLRNTYGQKLPYGDVKEEKGLYVIEHPTYHAGWGYSKGVPVANRIVIEEDITKGQHILGFRLYGRLRVSKDTRVLLYEGKYIGHKHIAVIPAMAMTRVELEVTQSEGEASVRAMSAHFAK